MRAYTIAATSLALGVTPKWLDNAVSHNKIPGVTQTRQGVSRRLNASSILILELAIILGRSLGAPLSLALIVAERISAYRDTPLQLESGFTLLVDIAAIEHDLAVRLADAVEVAPAPRRGRPPR